jgi:hypothetical protein
MFFSLSLNRGEYGKRFENDHAFSITLKICYSQVVEIAAPGLQSRYGSPVILVVKKTDYRAVATGFAPATRLPLQEIIHPSQAAYDS